MAMKKIFIVTVFSIFTATCFAQTADEQKFIGNWKYTGNNTEFSLLIKYGSLPSGGNALLVFHKLIRNDSLVQNGIPLLPEFGDYSSATGGVLLLNNDPNKAKGAITDTELSRPGRVILSYLSANQIRFELFRVSGPQKNYAVPFKLPYNVVLTKQ